jgi:hypothetical protein
VKLAFGDGSVCSWPIANLGPIPGGLLLIGGVIFTAGWITFAIATYFFDRAKHGTGPARVVMG